MTPDELVAEAVERSRFGRSGIYDVAVRRADGELLADTAFAFACNTYGTTADKILS